RFQWFNTACFVDAAFGTFGTSNQGTIAEPVINNWNITLKKGFFFGEGKELEFRGELFNAFNVTQWGTPTTPLASTSFGRIGSTRPARQLQFGLFFTFSLELLPAT